MRAGSASPKILLKWENVVVIWSQKWHSKNLAKSLTKPPTNPPDPRGPNFQKIRIFKKSEFSIIRQKFKNSSKILKTRFFRIFWAKKIRKNRVWRIFDEFLKIRDLADLMDFFDIWSTIWPDFWSDLF